MQDVAIKQAGDSAVLVEFENEIGIETNAKVRFGDHQRVWKRGAGDSVDIDTSIAMTYMMLEAHSLGLGCTWVCAFDQALCSEIFDIPSHMTPVSILALGYGDPTVPPREAFNRKTIEEVVSFEKL